MVGEVLKGKRHWNRELAIDTVLTSLDIALSAALTCVERAIGMEKEVQQAEVQARSCFLVSWLWLSGASSQHKRRTAQRAARVALLQRCFCDLPMRGLVHLRLLALASEERKSTTTSTTSRPSTGEGEERRTRGEENDNP